MAVSSVAQQRSPMRFRGRSYMAFALTQELPIVDWLTELGSSAVVQAGSTGSLDGDGHGLRRR
jgi:hypothetical protein